jgi:hypothetical protein
MSYSRHFSKVVIDFKIKSVVKMKKTFLLGPWLGTSFKLCCFSIYKIGIIILSWIAFDNVHT